HLVLPLADQQPRDRGPGAGALVSAGRRARAGARRLHRLRGGRVGDDAPGARTGAATRPGDQPRFLRQLRADADRTGDLGRDRRNRPAGADDPVGALVSAAMITVVLTRPWLRAVE